MKILDRGLYDVTRRYAIQKVAAAKVRSGVRLAENKHSIINPCPSPAPSSAPSGLSPSYPNTCAL
ncbi:MAG: hypothetical protein ACR2KU_06400 [Gammaproteobacteria bacterium]